MDLQNVRAFLAVAESNQFRTAGARLGISQQAVSKRIASLERELGLRLFARTPRGALLTLDGQALLPRAKELLRAEARALAAVRPDQRPLRVDVINVRLAPGQMLRGFHEQHPDRALDVVTMFDAASAIEAVTSGAVDATFRAAPLPGFPLPKAVQSQRVWDEPLLLRTGPDHPLADRASVRLAELAEHTIWMPSVVAGTEWAIYYAELERAFGITVDTSGTNFGRDAMREALRTSSTLATFVPSIPGEADDVLRLIELLDPTPVYPHSLIWHEDNHHPALELLTRHLSAPAVPGSGTWSPTGALESRASPAGH
ncbi:MAG: LysR family transcriptional regulator [Solirubrobacteraceae bacterium]